MELRESLFNNIEVFTERQEDGTKAITIEWNLTQVDQMAVELQAKRRGLTVEEFLGRHSAQDHQRASKGCWRGQGSAVADGGSTRQPRPHRRIAMTATWESEANEV